mmetsp:Transcript_20634/g.57465  ORF Transcript_20634/g.57465 Transcript_20634/m.57465 type:complete len:426 (-) Transcript_20634:176-1453(-)
MASLVWFGALLGIIASMSGTAGKQLLRFSELQKVKGTRASIALSKSALAIGLALNIVIGPLVDMASYAFAPQSIIAPLGGLDVVWNTLSAPCTLGEVLTPSLLLGCALIGGGATATSCVGSHEEQEYTLELLKDTFFREVVLAYIILLALWLAFNIVILIPRSAAPKGQPFASGDMVRGLSLGMTAGSIAGNMFCVKAFVEVVQASIAKGKAEYWLDWLPYVLFAGALFFATSNLYFLTKAMKEYEALFMGAVFEGSLIVSACISGCVVFDELKGMLWWEIMLYWIAVLVIIGGIAAVSLACTWKEDDVAGIHDVHKVVTSETSDEIVDASVSIEDVLGLPRKAASADNARAMVRRGSQTSPFRAVPLVIGAVTSGEFGGSEKSPSCNARGSGSPQLGRATESLPQRSVSFPVAGNGFRKAWTFK